MLIFMDPLLLQDHSHGNIYVTQQYTVVIDTLTYGYVIYLTANMIIGRSFMLHENFVSSNC